MRKNVDETFENRENYDFRKKTQELSQQNFNQDDYQDLAYEQTYTNKFYKQGQEFQNNYQQNFGKNTAISKPFVNNDSEDYSNFDYEDDDDIDFQSESQQDDFESVDLNVDNFKKQQNLKKTEKSQAKNSKQYLQVKHNDYQDLQHNQNQLSVQDDENSFRISKDSYYKQSNAQNTDISQQVKDPSRPDDFQEAEEFQDDLSEEVNQFYESQKLSKIQPSNQNTFKSDFEDVDFSESKISPKNVENKEVKKNNFISAFSFQKQDVLQSGNILQQKIESDQKNEKFADLEQKIDQQVQIKINVIQKEKENLLNENLRLKNEKFELQQKMKQMNKNVDTAFDQLSKTDLKREGYLTQMQKLNEELQQKEQILQQRELLIEQLQKDKICPKDLVQNKNQEIQILNEQIKYLKDENKILEENLKNSNNIKFEELNEKIKQLEDQLMEKENLLYQQKLQNKIDNINDKNMQEIITQEQIINGYIKENKRLIEENRFYRQNYYKEKIKQEQKFLNPEDPDAIRKEFQVEIQKMIQEINQLQQDLKQKQNLLQIQEKQIQELQSKNEIVKQKTPEKKQNSTKKNFEQKKFLNEYKKDKEEIKELIGQIQKQIKQNKVVNKKQNQNELMKDLKELINQLSQENQFVKQELQNLKQIKENNHQFVKTQFDNFAKQKNIEENTKNKNKQENEQKTLIELKKLREENEFLQIKTGKLSQQISKNREENEKLLEIIKKMPKHARNIDFAILEQKILNMEKEYQLKKLQYDNAIKMHSTLSINQQQETQMIEIQNQQNIIEKLKKTIQTKDQKLLQFKQSFDNLLIQFKKLKQN